MTTDTALTSSFRDPSGFVFKRNGTIYRQINPCYRQHYDRLMTSGLFQQLVDEQLLIPHQQITETDDDCLQIKPEQLNAVTWPYEWCFSQLKDAALTTLRIHQKAFEFGMILKDASAYNIQLHHGRPMLIDTLSFEIYQPGEPWQAYGQFCRHFLAPLALMSYTDIRLSQLLRVHLDGIPLDLAVKLLPRRAFWRFGLLAHLYLHARSQTRYAGSAEPVKHKAVISTMAFQGLTQSLQNAVERLHWQPGGTEWADYYTANNNYDDQAFACKKQRVEQMIRTVQPKRVWDIGANDGTFSRIAAGMQIPTLAFDIDPASVEMNYRSVRQNTDHYMTPILMDLTNPSPPIGWANRERDGWLDRGPVDMVIALALIHHLAIGNNVPLDRIASLLAKLCEHLIIEFVPKEDSQVKILLATREDIFSDYTFQGFEKAFNALFQITAVHPIEHSTRKLYLMRRR